MSEQISSKFPGVKHLSISEYKKLQLQSKKIILVDVRSAVEMDVSILPSAITKAEFRKNKSKYKDHIIITYCTIGYRSSQYALKLKEQGFDAVNLKGSLLAWTHQKGKLMSKGVETKKAHVYSEAWNFLPPEYEGIYE